MPTLATNLTILRHKLASQFVLADMLGEYPEGWATGSAEDRERWRREAHSALSLAGHWTHFRKMRVKRWRLRRSYTRLGGISGYSPSYRQENDTLRRVKARHEAKARATVGIGPFDAWPSDCGGYEAVYYANNQRIALGGHVLTDNDWCTYCGKCANERAATNLEERIESAELLGATRDYGTEDDAIICDGCGHDFIDPLGVGETHYDEHGNEYYG